jgi:hypothetical protein
MAPPIITSISPRRGHTGGRYLVEILGSGFRVQPDGEIGTGAPIPAPPQSVRVFFGAAEALDVQVWAEDRLYCRTPIMDPGRDVFAVVADPGTDTFTAAGHGLIEGELVELSTTDTLPAPLEVETPYRAKDVTPDTFQLSETTGGPAIDVTDSGAGAHSVDADAKLDVTVQNVEEAHGTVTSTTGLYDLDDGQTLLVAFDGGAVQTVVFSSGDFADIDAATADEVAAALNVAITGGRALVEAGEVLLQTDTAGPVGSVHVSGGTANAALGFSTDPAPGTTDLVQVGGEITVWPKAFAPVRPDLSQESHLSTTFGQFILELRRQILENVVYTTHTDYSETGAIVLDAAAIAVLPALVLVGIQVIDNNDQVTEREDLQLNDPAGEGDFVTVKHPIISDIIGTMIGVVDDDRVMFNMLQAYRIFFRDNPKLDVPRDIADPSAGTIEYDLETSMNATAAVSNVGDNTNVQFFARDFRIEGVRLEAMPGVPEEGIPLQPAGYPAAAAVDTGKTSLEVELSVSKAS